MIGQMRAAPNSCSAAADEPVVELADTQTGRTKKIKPKENTIVTKCVHVLIHSLPTSGRDLETQVCVSVAYAECRREAMRNVHGFRVPVHMHLNTSICYMMQVLDGDISIHLRV